MVFKRRVRPTLLSRMANFVWPQGGFRRGWAYIGHRVQRIKDSPEKIALGLALGIFISFTPFFGLHFVVAAFVAWLFRANVVAGLFGTMAGNPLSFPFIAASSMSAGVFLTGGAHDGDGEGVIAAFVHIGALLWESLKRAVGLGEPGSVSWLDAKLHLAEFFDQVMWPYLLGGTLIGAPIAVASYFILKPAVAAYQKRRRERLLQRARAIAAAR